MVLLKEITHLNYDNDHCPLCDQIVDNNLEDKLDHKCSHCDLEGDIYHSLMDDDFHEYVSMTLCKKCMCKDLCDPTIEHCQSSKEIGLLEDVTRIDCSGNKCPICEKIIKINDVEIEIDNVEIKKDCVDCNGPGPLYHLSLGCKKEYPYLVVKVGHLRICDKCLGEQDVSKVFKK